jgi:hypothetical protein
MPEFSKPPQGPGAPNPKIPNTVPLSEADEQRQEMYGPLADAMKADTSKLDIDDEQDAVEKEEESGTEPAPAPEDTFVPPSKEDRKAFLSAILGGKQYEKTFKLFDNVTITFRDRTIKDTEVILSILSKRVLDEELSQDDYDIAYDRYLFVVQLAAINGAEYAIKELNVDDRETLDDSVRDWLLALPRPVYHGALMAFRQFERENAFMTEHALDSDFWKADGQALPSRPPSAARSTTRSTRDAIRTGT